MHTVQNRDVCVDSVRLREDSGIAHLGAAPAKANAKVEYLTGTFLLLEIYYELSMDNDPICRKIRLSQSTI